MVKTMKLICVELIFICIIGLVISSVPLIKATDDSPFAGGLGTRENPYQITKIEHLNNVRDFLDQHFIVMNDLDFNDNNSYLDPAHKELYTKETGWDPIGYYIDYTNKKYFTGTFDGQNHDISNLYVNRPKDRNGGLFASIELYSVVKNIHLIDASIISMDDVGALTGVNNGNVVNCHATGTIRSNSSVGGLIGEMYGGNITGCSTSCMVTSRHGDAGGIVGRNIEGFISNCYTTGDISGNTGGGIAGDNMRGSLINCYATGKIGNGVYVGGLVGWNREGSIAHCYATGEITASSCVGGLVGKNNGDITSCYATGSITADYEHIGGFVGDHEGGNITQCYATGDVIVTHNGDVVGGFVGGNDDYIASCYCTGDVSGTDRSVGGFVGYNSGGKIINCYARGSVTGDEDIGGFAASNVRKGRIKNCYSTGEIICDCRFCECGGFVGDTDKISFINSSFWDNETSNKSSTAGTALGKTTIQMKTRTTFIEAGWDFSTVWGMSSSINDGYPYLLHCMEGHVGTTDEIGSQNTGTPGFEGIVFIFSLCIMLVLLRKRKRE